MRGKEGENERKKRKRKKRCGCVFFYVWGELSITKKAELYTLVSVFPWYFKDI